MKLVQIFIPLTDIDGSRFPPSYFQQLKSTFSEKFGGVTIYKQTPVEGFWKETEEKAEKDVLAIFEVLVDAIDRAYWQQLKVHLEAKFKQKNLLIRHWEATVI
ncbi:MAG TPA: hypothetical protein VNQ80_17695 [Parapedobacter sp.]|uniref:hypothetical protein n=1 Tax=Parapedobacter sp. TaxID=1958893 RepID=UPI002BE7BEB8|nr:hypothetical protein [Parapedobacter sp.]HWK59181.1 hypothetical protein [Parapedobacter sp.]